MFNEAFNVGQTAHNYQIRDLARSFAEVVPGCQVEFADGAGPDTRSYRVSFEKIKNQLPNFKPQWDAKKGAEQLYKAYLASGVTLEEFEVRVTSASDISTSFSPKEFSMPTCGTARSEAGTPRRQLRPS